jgi:hypothetical protein
MERGGHRPALGLLMGDGGAENRHHSVAGEARHIALVVVDGVENAGEAALHQGVHLLLADGLCDGGRAHGVGEEDGDGAALALQCRDRGRGAFGR